MSALPGIRRTGLRTKIIIWAFVPTAILLNVIALFTFYTYQKVTEELAVERNRELTRLLAGQLSTRLADYAELLGDLAALPGMSTGDASTQQTALTAQAGHLSAFDGGVAILDPSGYVVAANERLSPAVGRNWSGRPYLVPAVDYGASFRFSDVVAPGPQGATVVAVAVPIHGGAEGRAGSIVGFFHVDVETFSRGTAFYTAVLRKLRGWENGDVYLVDGTGRAIYHSDRGRIGQEMTAQDGVRQLLAGQAGAFRTRDLAGARIVIGFAPVPDTPWGLVTEEEWAQLAAASQRYRHLLIVFLALGLVVPVLLIALGVSQITKPIRELISAAQEIAEGDFDQQIVAQTGDELEDLAEQFNRMAAQLRESYTNLEQRVADRTRELSALYQVATVARASLDRDEILKRSLEQVLAVMECEVGAVYLLDEESAVLRLAAWYGIPPDAVAQATVVQPGEGLTGWVFEQREPVVVSRMADGPRPLLAFPAAGDQTYVGAPMCTTEQAVGVLSMVGAPGQQFSAEERALLAAIASQMAVTVENVRLRAEAEQVAVLRERERLARELHDSVTQSLYSLTLWIEAGQRSARADDLDRVEEYLERLEEGTRQAIRDMRLLVYELRPPALERDGLVGALQERLDAVEKRSGVQPRLVVEGESEFPSPMEEGLYRIAQEALNNALKHAAPSAVTVRLRACDAAVELEITDDGIGFDLAAVGDKGGMGLANMRQRAAQLGGTLSVLSAPGKGTRVCAHIPWDEPARMHVVEERDE
jgi:nitrate/nitrite-specific signal transduction histidine kinase